MISEITAAKQVISLQHTSSSRYTLSGSALTVLPWPQDSHKPGAIHLTFSARYFLWSFCISKHLVCYCLSWHCLGTSWWTFPRSKLKGGLREGRNNLNAKKCNGEGWQKEILNTRQCFLTAHSHNHGCASTVLLFSGLWNTAGCADPMIHQTFSKQTRLEGVSAIRNTLNKLMDFERADVSPSTCGFRSEKK